MNTSSSPAALGTLKLCFYGAGSMAEAIVRGLTSQGLTTGSNIGMLNRQNKERLNELNDRYGVITAGSDDAKQEMILNADILFLAMKPKDAAGALEQLRPLLTPNQLIISVIAGLSIRTIEQLLGRPMAVVRTMPNTSSTIGLGATGISYSSSVTEEQRALSETMFQAVGLTAVVEEPLLDVVTGVSGSGPAYIYYMMESMIAAGEKLGLTSEAAHELTVQTVLGAAEMVRTTGEKPAELRRKVTSPNGTTQAALETLDAYSFSEGIVRAVARAAERAGELGADIERSALK
ncbi:pyrroline-5-carboxylate reductase [Paenibacillus xylaniclasticus]|uniref:pyrroline-5-carboxylate reductase n=1 Tax=Paenibacillus xylaniclasticus TaxID=588083 RepID=UPI000FD99BCE|nr:MULTISPECIES: pyrroline-5-carboxylate reductase [Paenibacillus]GFN30708.1 pyrroline-5-carboxylate reductase [Paenibacillus curdlanolyticus]